MSKFRDTFYTTLNLACWSILKNDIQTKSVAELQAERFLQMSIVFQQIYLDIFKAIILNLKTGPNAFRPSKNERESLGN